METQAAGHGDNTPVLSYWESVLARGGGPLASEDEAVNETQESLVFAVHLGLIQVKFLGVIRIA